MSKTKTEFCAFMRRITCLDLTDDQFWEALSRDVAAEYEHKHPGQALPPITEEELQYAARQVLERHGQGPTSAVPK